MVPPYVDIEASIDDARKIQRLADLEQPQVILKGITGLPRSLVSIAATLCIVLPEGYSKKQLKDAGDAPDRVLPFPLIQISNRGLIIKLPKELTLFKAFVDSLQDLTQIEAKSIDEVHNNMQFFSEITIPLEDIEPFLNMLGLDKFFTIKDVVSAKY